MMGKNIDSKLLDRIKKLLSLATSDNEHEAKLAAEKANELLVRHNLSRQHIDEIKDESFEKEVLTEGTRLKVEEKFIRMLLAKYFFVKIIRSRNYTKTTMYILGEATNVQIATYTRSFLVRKFRDLWEVYKKQTQAPTTAKQSYYYGLYQGLAKQLESQKTKIISEDTTANNNALVVVNEALRTYVNKEYPRLSYSTTRIGVRDSNAAAAGEVDGEKIRINRGISSKGSQVNLLK